MGITTVRKRAKKVEIAPNAKIDISAFLEEGDTDTIISFREPRSNDYFMSPKRQERIKLKYPLFSGSLITQILTIASCYVPNGNEEPGVNLDDTFAAIADENRDMFLHIFAEFFRAFPSKAGKEEAGND